MNDNDRIIVDKRHLDLYFVMPRGAASDKHISWEARGVLAYILSKPNHWVCRNLDIQNMGPAGRDKITRIMNELKDAGYVHRERLTDEHGRFYTVTTVFPFRDASTVYGFTVDGSPVDGSPVDGKPVDIDHDDDDDLFLDQDQSSSSINLLNGLVNDLLSLGLSKTAIGQLAGTAYSNFGDNANDAVSGWIVHISSNDAIRNPAGFLVSKVKAGETPPVMMSKNPICENCGSIVPHNRYHSVYSLCFDCLGVRT